jgi:hypothetical protein
MYAKAWDLDSKPSGWITWMLYTNLHNLNGFLRIMILLQRLLLSTSWKNVTFCLASPSYLREL